MATQAVQVTRQQIEACDHLIRPFIRRTPVLEIAPSDFGITAEGLFLKLELLQHSGSFKARGAFANLLLRDVPGVGVIAASGGNHGAAVAYAAQRLGIPATIFVPRISSAAKLDRIRSYGAELVIGGERYADALAASQERAAKTAAMQIHAYDQVETLLGQGTVGFELEMDVPQADTVLVATGGGGLIGGIAAWYGGKTKVVAVESDKAPTLHAALLAGKPVDAPAGGTAADSLAPKRVGELMFPIAQAYVAPEVVLVSDDEIRWAQNELWSGLRLVAEPGGAAAFAALLSNKYKAAPGERVVAVICGANTTAVKFGTE